MSMCNLNEAKGNEYGYAMKLNMSTVEGDRKLPLHKACNT